MTPQIRPLAEIYELADAIGAENVGLLYPEVTKVLEGTDVPARRPKTMALMIAEGKVSARILPGKPPRVVMSDIVEARRKAMEEAGRESR